MGRACWCHQLKLHIKSPATISSSHDKLLRCLNSLAKFAHSGHRHTPLAQIRPLCTSDPCQLYCRTTATRLLPEH